MTMTKKLVITLLLLISIAFVHCLAFHVELEEFEPPQQEEQDVPRRGPGGRPGGRSGEGWQEESTEFPYHFGKRSFKNWFQSNEGFVKMLPKFTKRAPNLFRGIENYRFALFEMEPNTFLVPHHLDADSVVLVLQGHGVVEFVTDKTKESFHVTKGDVVRLPSGVTHYATNTNQTVPLRFVKIIVPVNNPGQFKDYFPARSQFQQSYFTGFSKEVLSASFNIPEELVGRLFSGSQQTGQGIMRRVSPDQIKELTKHATSPSNKHKETKSKHKDTSTKLRPFNLFTQDSVSTYTNDFGHFHEARPESFDQLQDLRIAVAWTNMSQGSLFLPHYNSKTTFVTFVENGCARYEMASPYSFQGEQQQQQWWPEQGGEEEEEDMSGQVHKIVSRVCKGDVFIIPAGHPVTLVSHNENFVSVGFGIHASNCTRTFLAGQENVLSNLDTVATRVTFGVGSKVAEKLFTSQNYSYFAPTTRSHQQTQEKREPSFQSIFSFAGF
ncbi:PREDICTED: vicilin-like seed storage protein At3g22640 [Camelina sativa]|uniref:Vicilin-like seed storage protein At3g22640 n=1 Tax=Camelina sativa TaxID=90675 RepID=A0AA51RIG8_CAMSA|nr:PREDICTED: vicilin-like seed storage protein At3g22640 [Camelina sativa]UNP61732.1 vicilin Vic1A-1-G3 [Camelina sativa]WMQ52467.1 Vicillin [Camelina sativa]